ncbi:hypothetical protein ACFX2A_009374 [Malus domestica]
MKPYLGSEWKALGIFDAIKLSTIEMNLDRELMMVALSFWCSASNTMVFPLSPLGPTVLDMTAILGTSPTDFSVNISLAGYKFDSNLKAVFEEHAVEVLLKGDQRPSKEEVQKLYKNFFNYNILITHFVGSEGENLKKGEHGAFLFYWYNKYLFCAKSNKCLAENMPVVDAVMS